LPVHADKSLTCRDCGAPFVFTAGEQEFHESRGFANSPSRCPDCRAARRAERGGPGAGGGGFGVGERAGYGRGGYTASGGYSSHVGGYDRPRRRVYSAVCAQCGKETEVPFLPTGAKPVYCADCFRSRADDSEGGAGPGRGGYSGGDRFR
jgi:CxxC-x17-CxxC domain-containing protein